MGPIGTYRVLGLGFRETTPIMENQMERKLGMEIEAGIIYGFVGIRIS